MKQLMMFRRAAPVPAIKLPEGWTIRSMKSGEEMVWVDICGDEFWKPEEMTALERWQKTMGSDPGVLMDHVYFACDPTGRPMATASLRLLNTEQLAHYPPGEAGLGYLHYVAARPEARGLGAGSAVTAQVVLRGIELGLPDSILTTDDYRLAAIKSYLRLGWIPVLYDETMLARWQDILKILNQPSVAMMNMDGTPC